MTLGDRRYWLLILALGSAGVAANGMALWVEGVTALVLTAIAFSAVALLVAGWKLGTE